MRSVALCGLGLGKSDLLLVGCGQFLVKIMQVPVLLGVKDDEVADEVSCYGDVRFIGVHGDFHLGTCWPRDSACLRAALQLEACRDDVGDLVVLSPGILEIYGNSAFFLCHEGMLRLGLEEQPWQEHTSSGDAPQAAAYLDNSEQIRFIVVEP